MATGCYGYLLLNIFHGWFRGRGAKTKQGLLHTQDKGLKIHTMSRESKTIKKKQLCSYGNLFETYLSLYIWRMRNRHYWCCKVPPNFDGIFLYHYSLNLRGEGVNIKNIFASNLSLHPKAMEFPSNFDEFPREFWLDLWHLNLLTRLVKISTRLYNTWECNDRQTCM